jgi:hypothetical protein
MSIRPNVRMALREAALQALALLACQAVLLALGWGIGWWDFVVLVVAMVAIRFAMVLRNGSRSKPVEGTRLPRDPKPATL